MKTNTIIFAAAAVAGFFLADTLVGFQPFTFAYTEGAKIGTR